MSYFQDFINYLALRVRQGLPGRNAHERMIPHIRLSEFPESPVNGIRSSVLLLLYPDNGAVKTVLILRPVYEGVHSGQIALPGGKYQQEDGDLLHTALREAKEEVGLRPSEIKLIGPLSDLFIPPGRFLLTPYLAYAYSRPEFRADPNEVDKIIETDVRDISDANLKEKGITLHSGRIVNSPYYDIQGHVVWGATGMILCEFAELIKEYNWS